MKNKLEHLFPAGNNSLGVSNFIFNPKHDLYFSRIHGGQICQCGHAAIVHRSRIKHGGQFMVSCDFFLGEKVETEEQQTIKEINGFDRSIIFRKWDDHSDPTPWCATLEEAISHWNVVAKLTPHTGITVHKTTWQNVILNEEFYVQQDGYDD